MDRYFATRATIEDELIKTQLVRFCDYAGLCGVKLFRKTLLTLENAGYSLAYINTNGQPTTRQNATQCKLTKQPAKRFIFCQPVNKTDLLRAKILAEKQIFLADFAMSKGAIISSISKIRGEFLRQNKTIAPIKGSDGKTVAGYRLVLLSGSQ